MKKRSMIFAAVAALAISSAAPVMAETAANAPIATQQGMRASKLLGSPVFNDNGQNIGSIVDVLVKSQGAEPIAILSVGDFVGGGSKYVAVPLSHVTVDGTRASMAGATKELLAAMPFWTYNYSGGNG